MNHNRDKIAIASLFIVGVVMVSAVAIYDDNQDLDAEGLHLSGQMGGVDWVYNNGTIDVFPSKNPAPGYEMGVMAHSDNFWWGLEYDSKYPGRAELIRVYVKEGVTSLSSDSFSWTGCNNHNSEGMGLRDVSLPNTLTTIGDRTF